MAECSVCHPQEKHEVTLKCFHILLRLSKHLNHALPVSFSGPLRALTGTNRMKLWEILQKTFMILHFNEFHQPLPAEHDNATDLFNFKWISKPYVSKRENLLCNLHRILGDFCQQKLTSYVGLGSSNCDKNTQSKSK